MFVDLAMLHGFLLTHLLFIKSKNFKARNDTSL